MMFIDRQRPRICCYTAIIACRRRWSVLNNWIARVHASRFATITGMEDSGTWQHVDLEISCRYGRGLCHLASRQDLPGQGVLVP